MYDVIHLLPGQRSRTYLCIDKKRFDEYLPNKYSTSIGFSDNNSNRIIRIKQLHLNMK